MGMRGPLVITAFLLVASGTLLHTIGMATPDWTVLTFSEIGPYTSCDVVACQQTPSVNVYIRAVKGLTMTAMALGVFSCICVIMMMPVDKPVIPIAAGALALLAFVLILTGVCVWAADVHVDHLGKADIGYSFIISIIGGILILAGGVVAVVAGRAK